MKKPEYLSGASFAEAEVRPLRVGRRLWIGPAGAAPPEDAGLVPIWLHAGPAFGVGAHPTTQLCLRALERHLPPETRVLDIGTGTGILAIAAARLGAASVRGLDIDPGALAVAAANVALNNVGDRVRLERGTLDDMLAQAGAHSAFGWVVVNILAHVLVGFLEQGLTQVLAPGGWLVLTGFLRSQTPPLRAALAEAGLELLAQEQQDDWICLLTRRPVAPSA